MVLIILIPVYFLFVDFFYTIERAAFSPWQSILLSGACIISITEFFSALIKVRLLLSSLKISTRDISGLASIALFPIVVTKQGLFGRQHLRKFYWLCDFPINYESGESLIQGWVKEWFTQNCSTQKFTSLLPIPSLQPCPSTNLKS